MIKPKDDLDAVREVVEAIKPFSEEEQKRIIKWACEKLGILDNLSVPKTQNVIPVIKTEEEHQISLLTQISKPKDIKTFVEGKNPKSDKQFAAVVAYYYQFEAPERKESIVKEDLVNATRLANWERLPRPDQTLVNAAHSGLLDKVADSRGQYRLNSVGENLVAMVLPNSEDIKPLSPKKTKKSQKIRKSKKR